jgi:hypothetical protein
MVGGFGAVAQLLTGAVTAVFANPPPDLSRALLMGAGWVSTSP